MEEKSKSQGQLLMEKLSYKKKNCYEKAQPAEIENMFAYAEGYKDFLDRAKTEREAVTYAVKAAEACGFRPFAWGETLKAGDKRYYDNRGKSVVLFRIGENDPETDGIRIVASHIDAPRIDIKQNPLYEDGGFAYLDTHYYGGIKKYQWVTLPLALHGVVAKKDGSIVEINIGENEDDPVFFISDLLIHLSAEQMEKKASKVIEGEALDLIFGSRPLAGEEKEAVKAGVMKLLAEQYGIEEEDFLSAELEVVPAGKAREAGLDRSMVLGYGQDDRVCSFTSLAAMLEVEEVEKTTCCLLTDKEEIGSVGATGMQSRFFENSVAELMDAMGEFSELSLRRCLANSSMLSSDVNAAYDPLFANAFEKNNASYFGRGVVFSKFTGSRGKSGSNDANAEYIARIRKMMDKNEVCFQ